MAYPTYITEALVCGSIDSNTADRSFLLFTREAGMVYAQAKSVREERSKQRYALQTCMHARLTLVRGKSGWRIAGAEPISDLYAQATTRASRALLRNLLLLIRRVIQGEMVHTHVFDELMAALQSLDVHDPEILELVTTLRILHLLGYIAPQPPYARFLEGVPYVPTPFLLSEVEIRACKAAVHAALHESQL